MTTATRIELDGVPSLAAALGRVLISRKSGRGPVPAMESHVAAARVDAGQLRAYCELLGIAHSDRVPVVFPQMMATAVGFEMLLADRFPFSALGLVHVRCQLCERRPLTVHEQLEVTCRLEGHREVSRGKLVTVETRIDVGKETPWQSSNDVLFVVDKRGRRPRRRLEPRPPATGSRVAHWDLPASLGRRYARVSGDYNPIHLFAATARLFGFRRAIAHGLWTLARSLVEMERELPTHPFAVEAEFKRPLFLPGRARFECCPHEGGIRWEVRSADGSIRHVSGRVASQ